MSKFLQLLFWLAIAALALLTSLLVFPSLIGIMLVMMFIVVITNLLIHRRCQQTELFNATLRTVCQNGGEIKAVALAFSNAGPSSGKYYEYSRRLMMGQDPIEAAAKSNIQLELSTAIAMQLLSDPDKQSAKQSSAQTRPETLTDDPPKSFIDQENDPPGLHRKVETIRLSEFRGQIIYLAIAGLFTALTMVFCTAFIFPTMNLMFEEHGISPTQFHLFLTHRSKILLGLFVFVIGMLFFMIPARWNPLCRIIAPVFNIFPAIAQRKAKLLHGMADAIDAGWPIGKALTIAHMTSLQSHERLRLQYAMEWIEQGKTPIESIRQAGWIDGKDVAWMEASPPSRIAQVMRSVGNRHVRDSVYNLGWVMQLFHPICLFGLALVVGWFAYCLVDGVYGMVITVSKF